MRKADDPALSPVRRSPQRITITIPWQLYQRLLDISDQQGHSLSNLTGRSNPEEVNTGSGRTATATLATAPSPLQIRTG